MALETIPVRLVWEYTMATSRTYLTIIYRARREYCTHSRMTKVTVNEKNCGIRDSGIFSEYNVLRLWKL